MEPRLLGRRRAARRFPAKPCERCGSTVDVHRHHRDGDQSNNDPGNIAFLCKDHHWQEHADMAEAHVGRPRGGVRPRVNALNRDRAVEQARRAATLRDAGITVPEIARRMGVHRETVRRWFAKYPV